MKIWISIMAAIAIRVRNVERSAERTVRITGDDLLSIFAGLVADTYITQHAGGR